MIAVHSRQHLWQLLKIFVLFFLRKRNKNVSNYICFCVCVGGEGGWKQQIWAARCITSWILTSHLIIWTRLGPFHVSQCRKSFYQYRSHISQLPMSHTSLGSLSSRRLLTHSEMWLQIHLVLLVYLRGAGRGGALQTASQAWPVTTDATCCKSYSYCMCHGRLSADTRRILLNGDASI